MAKQLIPLYWIRMPQTLVAEEGIIVGLDLHYPAHLRPATNIPFPVLHATPRYPLVRVALPGHYTVRLTSDRTSCRALSRNPRDFRGLGAAYGKRSIHA